MKKCSTCGREYGDANLRFCTEDGGSLIEVKGGQPAEAGAVNDSVPTVFPGGGGGGQNNPPFNSPGAPAPFGGGGYGHPPGAGGPQENFNYHSPTPPFSGGSYGSGGAGAGGGGLGNTPPVFNAPYNSRPSAAPSAQKSKLPIILGGLALLALLGGVAVAGIAGFVWYSNSGGGGNRGLTNNFAENRSNSRTRPTPVVNTNSYSPSNTNRGAGNTSANTGTANTGTAKNFESLRQRQLGSFRLENIEKTSYMKMYPNLEEESLTYVNSAGKKVFVNKTRFTSRAEAERVLRDLVRVAQSGGAKFTPVVACFSNDGREVGVTATRTADKGGARNYTIYYSQDNVVTFMFNLENDKAAVDEIFKHSEY